MMFSTKTEVLHYAPSQHMFFNGYGGYQVLAKVVYLFGRRLPIVLKVLDREEVPHYAYVQQRTLGFSEWQSRLLTTQTVKERINGKQ